ncbi:hypothetical protein JOD63_001050 [Microbacterium terrae]|uniref:Uncharacterized protein n=1 Tax=Microbacterium terrae TaxID=69369 RepID=A0A0M2GYS1_9MICO|nr:hypothetical protein [Microbacterium terrae]KJL38977.1 hypothetical protein RS81_02389 [Microbacterium terrae]MBP1077082.1 hypothetical protein [Microbacterium terrae]GLJ99677.1 hypothetical protein GCM10017594_28750 [Microbacterium terrae]
MDLHQTTVAARLNEARAAALDREIAMLASIADRGATLTPERPAVTAIERIGVWLRRRIAPPAGRIRFSH